MQTLIDRVVTMTDADKRGRWVPGAARCVLGAKWALTNGSRYWQCTIPKFVRLEEISLKEWSFPRSKNMANGVNASTKVRYRLSILVQAIFRRRLRFRWPWHGLANLSPSRVNVYCPDKPLDRKQPISLRVYRFSWSRYCLATLHMALSDKTITLVTGANQGIGLAVSKKLA